MSILISNPPYNMNWEVPLFAQTQDRFSKTELPPSTNANFAFILTALELSERSVFILPCGVLTTENKNEKEIRKYLVSENLIDTIITCPDNMFEATSIPTCIIVFDKNKKDSFIEMVDMRNKFEIEIREQRGQFGSNSHTNRIYKKEVKIFTDDIMQEAFTCMKNRDDIEGYCKNVPVEDVLKNDFVLTPSRYITPCNCEKKNRSYDDIICNLNSIISEKNCCKLTINETLAKNFGFDIDLYKTDHLYDSELNNLILKITGSKILKHDYFSTTKNKNELSFENNNKDKLSSILLMIMNTWKQHIFYLNNEENKLLAELRDNLVTDLMSGEIQV